MNRKYEKSYARQMEDDHCSQMQFREAESKRLRYEWRLMLEKGNADDASDQKR